MPSIREKLADKKSKLATPQKKMDDHPASPNGLQEGNFYTVEVELIPPDPNQPRKYFDPAVLEELSSSIKQKGILQPIIIRKEDNGTIYLVAGERRFRAAKMAGLTKISDITPCCHPLELLLFV